MNTQSAQRPDSVLYKDSDERRGWDIKEIRECTVKNDKINNSTSTKIKIKRNVEDSHDNLLVNDESEKQI